MENVETPLLERFTASPLAKGLTRSEIEGLFEVCEMRRFEAKAKMFVEGTPGDALWLILDGRVAITRNGKDLAEIGPGGALGELSLFRQLPNRSATAQTLTAVVALRFPGPHLRRLRNALDTAMLKVVNNLAQQMADRLMALNEKVVSGNRKGLADARTDLRKLVG